MKNLLDKAAIIRLKQEGLSNRGVARSLGIDKKTVNKYWNEYKENIQKLNETIDTPLIPCKILVASIKPDFSL